MGGGGGKVGGRGRWRMENRIKGEEGQGENYIQFHRDITHLPAAPVCLGSWLLPDSCLCCCPAPALLIIIPTIYQPDHIQILNPGFSTGLSWMTLEILASLLLYDFALVLGDEDYSAGFPHPYHFCKRHLTQLYVCVSQEDLWDTFMT